MRLLIAADCALTVNSNTWRAFEGKDRIAGPPTPASNTHSPASLIFRKQRFLLHVSTPATNIPTPSTNNPGVPSRLLLLHVHRQQDTDRTIDSTLRVFRQRDVPAATPAAAAAGPLAAAAAAAAKNAGFDVDGGRSRQASGATAAGRAVAGGPVGALRQQDDEARTIVLERCGALVRSYGAKKQAVAVDNLLASMVKAGVQMNARFLNNALVSFFFCRGVGGKSPGQFLSVLFRVDGPRQKL